MKHQAAPSFWKNFEGLPQNIKQLANENFTLLKSDSRHPSLHLKKVGRYWSARVGLHYRVLGVEHEGDVLWIWIGSHAAYDRLVSR